MNPDLFREYDIRGRSDTDLTPGAARLIGRAFATIVRRSGGARVALGRDGRLSSPALLTAVAEGLLASGLDVLELGMVPTPVVYFTALTEPVDAAIQVTGSHNPPEYNGLKLMVGEHTLSGDDIQELRRVIELGGFVRGAGHSSVLDDPIEAYARFIADRSKMAARPPRLVVDGGNGAGGPTALRVLRALGLEVIPLYCEPDGRFPNHPPDPTAPRAVADLSARVLAETADFGVAFDGDADRLVVVDERGRMLAGDELLVVLARDLLSAAPGATIMADVKCSQRLFDDIARHGGQPIMWKVGHSLIKARMKMVGAALAGELSGHVYYAHRYLGFDDPIYTTSRLAELLSRREEPLSALLRDLPQMYASPEIRIDTGSDAIKHAVAAAIVRSYLDDPPPGVREIVTVDGARLSFDDGWGLVRAGHTAAAISIRAEATTPERRDAICDEALDRVRAEIERRSTR